MLLKQSRGHQLCSQVGSIWGFGDKTDGTVIDYTQFAEKSVGGYFVNDIAEVEDW